jgi:hypothetical protein
MADGFRSGGYWSMGKSLQLERAKRVLAWDDWMLWNESRNALLETRSHSACLAVLVYLVCCVSTPQHQNLCRSLLWAPYYRTRDEIRGTNAGRRRQWRSFGQPCCRLNREAHSKQGETKTSWPKLFPEKIIKRCTTLSQPPTFGVSPKNMRTE